MIWKGYRFQKRSNRKDTVEEKIQNFKILQRNMEI